MVDRFPTFRKWRRAALIVLLVGMVAGVSVWLLQTWDPLRHTILVDGVEREYLLHVPQSKGEGLRPLVLAFHGYSGTAEGMRQSSELHHLALEKNFYLAYIEGNPTWQFFVRPGATVSADVAMFDRLCDELVMKHPIDPERIYVVGMSKGGDFAVYLAERRSARIAAVVSQGACVPQAVQADRPIPIMFIVGTKDNRVPQSYLPRVPQAFRDHGHPVKVIQPEGVGHRWHVPLNPRLWQFLSVHRLKNEPQATKDTVE